MGQERAQEWVDRYADLLLRIGYTWFSNLPDAQDLCQTVLLKLLETDPHLPDPEQEKAWVIRIAVNQCKNLRRSAWRRKTVALEEGLALTTAPPEEDRVLPLVQALPPKYRRVIYLRYYEEYRVEEIAQLLHMKPALVSTHLSRARAKLKTMWEEEEHEAGVSE